MRELNTLALHHQGRGSKDSLQATEASVDHPDTFVCYFGSSRVNPHATQAERLPKSRKQTKHAIDSSCESIQAQTPSLRRSCRHHAPEGSPPIPPLHGSRPLLGARSGRRTSSRPRASQSFIYRGWRNGERPASARHALPHRRRHRKSGRGATQGQND